MIRLKLLAATAMLSVVIATPVFAQAAIPEPGEFAFYHPNADLGIGSTRSVADALASEAPGTSGSVARFRNATMSHPLPAKRIRSVKMN